MPSSNLFSSQTRSTSLSSYTRQISDNSNRMSAANSLSSSKLEPTSSLSSTVRSVRTPQQSANVTPKPFVILYEMLYNVMIFLFEFSFRQTRGVTLYQCVADNESELSFNANAIVTQSKIFIFKQL